MHPSFCLLQQTSIHQLRKILSSFLHIKAEPCKNQGFLVILVLFLQDFISVMHFSAFLFMRLRPPGRKRMIFPQKKLQNAAR